MVRFCERPVPIQSRAGYSPVTRLPPEVPELAQRASVDPGARLDSSADPPGSSSPEQVGRAPPAPLGQAEQSDAQLRPQEAGAGRSRLYLRMFPQTFEAGLDFLSRWAGKNVNRISSDSGKM